MPNDNNTTTTTTTTRNTAEQPALDFLNEKLFGGATVIELANGNPNTPPRETEWQRFMAGTSKGFDLSPNSVTSDADDQGGVVETIITNIDFSIKFDGEVRKKDVENEFGFHKMLKFIVDAVLARQQPALWVRFNLCGSVITAFMVVTAYSSDGGTSDLYTCSAEFKIAKGSTLKVELI